MTAVTVGFVIGQATSTRQSPIYKAILDFDTGVQSKVVYIFTMFCWSQQQLVGLHPPSTQSVSFCPDVHVDGTRH